MFNLQSLLAFVSKYFFVKPITISFKLIGFIKPFKLIIIFFSSALYTCATCARVDRLEQVVESLSRQLIRQQLFMEERIRSDGDSDIKQVRVNHGGTKVYFVPHHTATAVGKSYKNNRHRPTTLMNSLLKKGVFSFFKLRCTIMQTTNGPLAWGSLWQY